MLEAKLEAVRLRRTHDLFVSLLLRRGKSSHQRFASPSYHFS